MLKKYLQLEKIVSSVFRKYSIPILSISMGIIYLWFGFLKIVGKSPAEELVSVTTAWIGIENFVIFLGFWEMAIGLCFLVSRWIRAALWLLIFHIPGIFLPILISPAKVFTVFPFGLTIVGQYIIKNLLVVAVGIVLFGTLGETSKKNKL